MKILTIVLAGFLAVLAIPQFPQDAATPAVGVPVAPTVHSLQANEAPANGVRLRECSEELSRGRAWLSDVPAYTATLRKQERLGDRLRDENTIELKLRHQPFSVMMRWLDEGRIVYYREGDNDNRMTVRMGGWKGRLGWIHLDPHSSLAMSEARYPVTQVGLMGLIDELLRQWTPYNDRIEGVHCEWLDDDNVGGRPCRVFRVTYARPEVFAEYRQSIVWLDVRHSVPLRVLNYDWERDDPTNPEGLVEHYIYENVDFEAQVADADFRVPDRKLAKSQVALQDGRE